MEHREFDDSIFVKFLSGTGSEGEEERLINYLNESAENRLNYFRFKRIWQESKKTSVEPGFVEKSWQRLNLRMDESKNDVIPAKKSNIRILWRKLSVAASVAILIGTMGYWGYQKYQGSKYPVNELQVNAPLGSRSNVVLPDGSEVWLNSGSRLTYNDDFGKSNREVSLLGEAFFDVAHSKKSDFRVKTSDLVIKVLGTRFNVKSYPEEHVIETTLVEGKIELEEIGDKSSLQHIIMTPNQKLIYKKKAENFADKTPETKTIIPEESIEAVDESVSMESELAKVKIINKMDTQEETSWKDGKLIIKHESLALLAPILERYYNVNITFADDRIKEFVYTGTLNEVTIEEVLRALEKTSPIRFTLKNNNVTLALTEQLK